VTASLNSVLADYAVKLPPDQVQRIDEYCRLLWEWNARLNLTRHADYGTFVSRDVIDSIHLAACLESGESVLDVGSGGGVPGILLAILRPDVQVTLSESVGKKAHALSDIVERLKLPAPVIHGRAEQALVDRYFDSLVARAVGSLAHVLKSVESHWGSIGRLLLIKGPRWVEERKAARHLGLLRGLELRRLATYPMPGTASESVILLVFAKEKPDPAQTVGTTRRRRDHD
jgi:16S rRNA (guanine527-N7)-methyltransferase